MKHKVADLSGALLDAAVGMCEGDRLPDYWRDPDDGTCWLRPGREEWQPSKRWEQGGPILERERIGILPYAHEGEYEYDSEGNNPFLTAPPRWFARIFDANTGGWIEVCPEATEAGTGRGPTPLIAAMRAYVASKFGEEVELP